MLFRSGSDALGPNRPNDELNRVSKSGENFGFPYCHDASIPDPEFGAKRSCSEFTQPIFGIGAHVAALGMKFSGPHASNAGDSSILIARHGSHPPIRVGYDVVKISIKAGSDPVMEPLLTGFLQGKSYWGRPVDILILSDGSVLVSDDLNGAIYRISKR